MAELSRQLGSVYGRLQAEFVFPVIRRVIYLLKKQGRIELPEVDGREVQIRSVSPMLRAQRNEDISQHINFATVVGQLFGPELVQTIINPSKYTQKLSQWYEVDQSLLRDESEQNQLAAQAAQQQMGQAGGGEVIEQLRNFLP